MRSIGVYRHVKTTEDRPHARYISTSWFILEHILVAEKLIGRYVQKDEVVHHKDMNKGNNDVSNLMVFRNNRDHTVFHHSNFDMSLLAVDDDGVYYVKEDAILPGFSTYVCMNCGKQFTAKNDNHKKNTIYCSRSCYAMSRRATDRPSLEQLLSDLQTMTYCAVGRKYGVSDNCIRKWIRKATKEQP